jgi:hypothetical protein
MQHRFNSASSPSLCLPFLLALCLLIAAVSAFAQRAPVHPINARGGAYGNSPVIKEPPPPVVIDNKPASEMTDDELIEFLQQKVQDIDQGEGEVRLLRIAPGYPLSLFFPDNYQDVILGDPGMLDVVKTGRGLVLSPKARLGDTSMQVVFSGQRRLVYHVFIAPNFSTGMTSLRVNFSSSASGRGEVKNVSLVGHDGNLNLRYIAAVISNYDALIQERAIDTQSIRRFPIFRKSKVTPFTYYDIFRFRDGTIAVTFSLENRSEQPVRINESRIRVVIGNLEFIPDYASINHLMLEPGGKTPGFIVLARTPFQIDQPFELNWR